MLTRFTTNFMAGRRVEIAGEPAFGPPATETEAAVRMQRVRASVERLLAIGEDDLDGRAAPIGRPGAR